MWFNLSGLTVTIVALAAVVHAQDLPTCASGCMSSAATAVGCDSVDNTSCVCSSLQYISSVRQCMDRACNRVDQEAGVQRLNDQCQPASEPLPTSTTPILTTTIANPPATQTFTTLTPPSETTGGVSTVIVTSTLSGGTGAGEGTGPRTGAGNGSGTGDGAGGATGTGTGIDGAATNNAATRLGRFDDGRALCVLVLGLVGGFGLVF